jgi:solute carrier family 35 (UDP-sugar transporter), member A1/2/3
MFSNDSRTLKYGALLLLVAQNTFLVLLMRVSRTTGGSMYASSTAVVCMECLKLITCFSVVFCQQGFSTNNFIKTFQEEVVNQPWELVKLGVPSILYVIQNNLLYFALSHLDAATYLVGYQLKILTTALFSTLILGKVLTALQWVSLIILTIGVSLAQLHTQSSSSLSAAANKSGAADISDHPLEIDTTGNLMGFLAVILAACTSGFSGIYFEKILKGSKTSLWMRNIQMGLSSTVLAFIGAFISDGSDIIKNGFFYGYTSIVIGVILLQALGGLVVAVVVKYADNILKGFAASFSILTSCFISYFFLDFEPSISFILGASLVLFSSYIYEKGLPSKLAFLGKQFPWLLVKVGKTDEDNNNNNNNNNNDNKDDTISKQNSVDMHLPQSQHEHLTSKGSHYV